MPKKKKDDLQEFIDEMPGRLHRGQAYVRELPKDKKEFVEVEEIEVEDIVVPVKDIYNISLINKMKYGDVIKGEPFNIRKVLGGFLYEFSDAVVFVPYSEFKNI